MATCIAALLTAGCGGASTGAAKLVDPHKDPPINGLVAVPGSRDLLLSTNRGLFRIREGSEQAERVGAKLTAPEGRSGLGRFLTIAADGPQILLGSGHPDQRGKLPPFLGLMVSRDGGRHWSARSRMGLADLHVIHPQHGRIYAYDAVLGAVLVGDAQGRSWKERRAPNDRLLDLAVDPRDPRRLVASDREAIYGSDDEGATWRRLATARSARLTWPRGGRLFRADSEGEVFAGSRGGSGWERIAVVSGEPWKLTSAGPRRLLMGLRDGRILESEDGGVDWHERFKP